jgi:hypothetical protein
MIAIQATQGTCVSNGNPNQNMVGDTPLDALRISTKFSRLGKSGHSRHRNPRCNNQAKSSHTRSELVFLTETTPTSGCALGRKALRCM